MYFCLSQTQKCCLAKKKRLRGSPHTVNRFQSRAVTEKNPVWHLATWIGRWSQPGFEVDLTDFWEKEWAFHHCRWRLWLQPTSHRWFKGSLCFIWVTKQNKDIEPLSGNHLCLSDTEWTECWKEMTCFKQQLQKMEPILEQPVCLLWKAKNVFFVCHIFLLYYSTLWSYTTITLSLKADIVNTSLETVSNVCLLIIKNTLS